MTDQKPKHPFTSERKLPLGVPDPSLRFCDDCGEKFDHPLHRGADPRDEERSLLAAIRGES